MMKPNVDKMMKQYERPLSGCSGYNGYDVPKHLNVNPADSNFISVNDLPTDMQDDIKRVQKKWKMKQFAEKFNEDKESIESAKCEDWQN